VLAAVTAVAVCNARRAPFVLVGWAWFVVSLLPVIGLVQIGMQSTADRYTYVPLIGIFLALAWTAAAIADAAPPWSTAVVAGIAASAVVACGVLTLQQLTYWRTDVALYRHALAVTRDNFVAHNNLGLALVSGGDASARAEAARHFAEALRLRPAYPEAHNNLGGVLLMQGRRAEAIEQFTAALRAKPDFAAAQRTSGSQSPIRRRRTGPRALRLLVVDLLVVSARRVSPSNADAHRRSTVDARGARGGGRFAGTSRDRARGTRR